MTVVQGVRILASQFSVPGNRTLLCSCFSVANPQFGLQVSLMFTVHSLGQWDEV